MNGYKFEDMLELFGFLGGGLVVIVALGTLIGSPWSVPQNATAGLLQTLGVLLTLLVGLATIAFTYAGDISTLAGTSDSAPAEE